MNRKKKFKSFNLKGKRAVTLLGNLVFFYPIILEGEGLVNPAGLPAHKLTDDEILAAFKRLTLKEIMERGESMLTYKWKELPPPPFKH